MANVSRAYRGAVVVGMSIALAASVSALGVASTTLGATPSAVPVVGDGEPWIVFQQFLDKSTVTLARPDGSDLHSPTLDVPGGDQTNPDWSSDGSQLVFAVAGDDRENLWIVNADGTDARVLAECEGDCMYLDDPDWSPDGEAVLFSRMRRGDGGTAIGTLEQVDVASGETSVIVQAEPGHFFAGQRWSPDGTSIVLEIVQLSGATMDSDVVDVSLAIIDLAAPTPAGRELLGSGRFPETATWAPDGSLIVFGALDEPGGSGPDLYAINPDGTGLRQVTTLASEGGSATQPEVTADGASVVFVATIVGIGGPVLGQIDLDGGEIIPATGAEFASGVHPRLRPVAASHARE
jgi:Tol biopolymer transport system component